METLGVRKTRPLCFWSNFTEDNSKTRSNLEALRLAPQLSRGQNGSPARNCSALLHGCCVRRVKGSQSF